MTDIEQLSMIFQNLGTPSEASWPGVQALPNYLEFQRTQPPPLKSIFPKVCLHGLIYHHRISQSISLINMIPPCPWTLPGCGLFVCWFDRKMRSRHNKTQPYTVSAGTKCIRVYASQWA